MSNFIETRARSLAKTVIWRVVATIITWIVIYFWTGRLEESIEITITAAIFGMIAYYVYERAWNLIKWGKVVHNANNKS